MTVRRKIAGNRARQYRAAISNPGEER